MNTETQLLEDAGQRGGGLEKGSDMRPAQDVFRGVVMSDSRESIEEDYEEDTHPLEEQPPQNALDPNQSEYDNLLMEEEGQDTVNDLIPKKINKTRLNQFNDSRRTQGANESGTVTHATRSVAQTQRSMISKKSKSISIHPPTQDFVWETKSRVPDSDTVSKQAEELQTLNRLTK